MLNRSTCTFAYPEIADGMVGYASNAQNPVYGDCNNGGNVDAIDFALLKKYILTPEHTYSKDLDVNFDNEVNAVDLAILKKYLLGSISSLPNN